jgi:DNA repair protein RecO (recombination protein O)
VLLPAFISYLQPTRQVLKKLQAKLFSLSKQRLLTQVLHKTKGIVLRVTKYGETSLIVLIYTEQFGIQTYLVQGVRTSSVKKSSQANYFQPGAILDLVVYHHEQKSLQRIREYKWAYLYESLLFDVIKNSMLLYIIELVIKTIKQPENNANLFSFLEEGFIWLDKHSTEASASFPIYAAIHLTSFLGFQIHADSNPAFHIFQISEGKFSGEAAVGSPYFEGEEVLLLKELMNVMHPDDLREIPLNRKNRQQILEMMEAYYKAHIPEFGQMKTLPVLRQILS